MRLPIECDEYTEEELLKMKKSEATKDLTEKVQRFCEYYVEGHNRRVALIKAGFGKGCIENGAAAGVAYRLLHDKRCKRYICWMKARIMQETLVTSFDIIDHWVRIAFADMTDFVDIAPHSIRLKPQDQVDGQLIKSIKSGRDGISIELHDKMKALDNLAKYTKDMPAEWKQKLEERRMELMEQEFEFKKNQAQLENPVAEDDEFIEAIKQSSEYIWSEE